MTQNSAAASARAPTPTTSPACETEQLYQQDVFRATQSTRSFGGNITGNWREYLLSGTMDHIDYFNGPDERLDHHDQRQPSADQFQPRRARRSGKSPLYFGLGSEYVTILRSTRRTTMTISEHRAHAIRGRRRRCGFRSRGCRSSR